MEDTNLTADWHNEKQPLTSPSHDWQTTTPPGPRSPPTSSAARNTGEYSRLWRSPTFLQSQRTSSETVRVSLEEPPAKYIGVEMNKALHKNRISMCESGDGRPAVRSRKFWSWITNRERTGILSWMPEHLWILASYGCMMGIVVLLSAADGKPPPDWPGPFTLNVVVSLLTALAQAAYMVPVVEGLGQMCWLRYSKQPRSLGDFKVMDGATRGVHGSLRLLVSFKGGFLGLLAALISFSSLFTSAFTQVAITYTIVPGTGGRVDGSNLAPRNTTLEGTSTTQQIIVHTRSAYLIFPIVQAFLATVFISAIMVWTQREDLQAIKTSSMATMVALKDDTGGGDGAELGWDGSGSTIGGSGYETGNVGGLGIGSIADMGELERKSATVMVTLERSSLSGLALGLVPVDGGSSGGGGRFSRQRDVESQLTGGNFLTARMDAVRERRRRMKRSRRFGGTAGGMGGI